MLGIIVVLFHPVFTKLWLSDLTLGHFNTQRSSWLTVRLLGAPVLWLQNHLQSSAFPTVLDGSEALLLICCVWVTANLYFSVICLNDIAPEVLWLVHIQLCSCVAMFYFIFLPCCQSFQASYNFSLWALSGFGMIFLGHLFLRWLASVYLFFPLVNNLYYFKMLDLKIKNCRKIYKGTHVSIASAVKQTGTYLYRSLSCGVQLRVTSAFPSTSSLNTLVMFWGPLTWKSWML